MKKTILMFAVAAAAVVSALADQPVRAYKTVPAGTNVVVAVRFAPDQTVNPTAYDIAGVSGGTCAVYSIRNVNGSPVTNTYVSATDVAATNAISNADAKKYLYGDQLLFLFSLVETPGQIWVYGDAKQ